MARRGKTKIGGSENMQQATAARRRQSDDAVRAKERAEDRGERTAQRTAQGISAGTSAIQQQMDQEKQNEFRSGEAEKERAFRGEQAEAGRSQQQEQFDARMEQQQEQFDARMEQQTRQQDQAAALDRTKMNLQAAQAGIQEDERTRRLREQLEKGSEFKSGTFTTSDLPERAMKVREEQALTQRANVYMQQQRQYRSHIEKAAEAQRKGDEADFKVKREAAAEILESASKKLESIQNERITEWEKDWINKMAENNPDPDVQAELERGVPGPAVARLIKSKIVHDSLKFVAGNGEFPNRDLVDEAHPLMIEFGSQMKEATDFLNRKAAQGLVMKPGGWKKALRAKRKAAAAIVNQMRDRASELKRQQNAGPINNPGAAGAQPGAAPPGAAAPGPGAPGAQPGAAAPAAPNYSDPYRIRSRGL